MSVHLRGFLSKTPVGALRLFLTKRSDSSFNGIDWQLPRQALVDALLETFRSMQGEALDDIYSSVDLVGQFMAEHGRQVLRSVVDPNSELLDAFDAQEDVTACALLVLDQDAAAFDRAVAANYVQRLLNGRNWTGLDLGGDAVPTVRKMLSLHGFEDRLQRIFSAGGPPPRVVVKRFARHEPDTDGSTVPAREQFTIYIEAPPETLQTFGAEATIDTQTIRPVLEGALLLDVVDGTLDIVCKRAGKQIRTEIADAFIETVLEPGPSLALRSRRNLQLDLLKQRPKFELFPEDGVRRVEIAALTLSGPDPGFVLMMEARGVDLFDKIANTWGDDSPLAKAGWPVLSAKLRVYFEPERPEARAKIVTFELKAPDRTNLRDQVDLHRKIADVLLARWGLYSN